MKNLDRQRVKQGQNRLRIALGVLILVHLTGFVLNLDAELFSSANRWQFSRLALIVVAAFGTLRGSNPIRFLLMGLLGLLAVGSLYLLTQGPPTFAQQFQLMSDIAVGGLVLALLILDARINEFLAYQRSQNFGERVAIKRDKNEKTTADTTKESAANGSDDSWDQIDDLYE